MSTSTMMSFIQPPLQLKPTFQEVQNWPTVRLDVELLEYKCVNADIVLLTVLVCVYALLRFMRLRRGTTTP